MSNKTDKWIDDNFDKIVSSLQGIVRIPSVEAVAEGPGIPFGKNVKAAEDYMLKLAGEYSFDTFEKGGKYCCVDAGQGDGKEMLGIICHLDVVPEGSGFPSLRILNVLRKKKDELKKKIKDRKHVRQIEIE